MSVGVMSPMSHFGPMGHYGSMGQMGYPGAMHAGGCQPVDESADVQLSTELPSEDPSVEGACGAEGQEGEMDPNATTMNPQLLEMLAYVMLQFMAAFQQNPSSDGGGGGGGGGGVSGPAAVTEAPAQPATGGGDAGPLSGAAQTQALQPGESLQVAQQWKDNLKKDFGLNDAQAAGIVGNLWHESGGMNSGITQGGGIGRPNGNMADDNGNGYGIAQWGGVRKQGLIDFAKANKLDPSSQAANYGYLKQELQGEYKGAIDAVKGTNDVAGATAAFCNSFEKPSDPQMASRLEYAMKLG